MTKITIEVRNLWDKEAAYELLKKELDRAFEIKREKLKELLELSIEMGVLITLTDEQLRGMGKTSAIIEKSRKLGAPIVTTSRQQKDYLEAFSGLTDIRHFNSPEATRGVRFPNGFIVDEGVSDDVIKQLIKDGSKLLGGFKRL